MTISQIDGLYLHIPFCFHKCHYCDFFSVVDAKGANSSAQTHFTDALISEFRHWSQQLQGWSPRTIFVGGGTPTFLRPELWQVIFDGLNENDTLSNTEEFSVEANPETVTDEMMLQFKAHGINRISMGAQSFNQSSLNALERKHNPATVSKAVEAVRKAGITEINLDLIFAIPGQTLAMLDKDLDQLLALDPEHVSIYGLTYEPQTALSARLKAGHVTAVDESLERDMYLHIIERLDQAGFDHYEISNWAKRDDAKDHRCQHNLIYWRNQNWLGIGPSAASHLDGHRFKNISNLQRYLQSAPLPEHEEDEHLPQHRRIGETFMLGLRLLREGVPRKWMESALTDPHSSSHSRKEELAWLIENGYLLLTEDNLRLTAKALPVANSVIAKLL